MPTWEETKAAEKKALLEMVEERHAQSYGRKPKKIGMMTCKTGIKAGYQEQEVSYVLRLNDAGEFIAEYNDDTWYASTSKEALQVRMDLVSKATLDLQWTRYLCVAYSAEGHEKAGKERGYRYNQAVTLRLDQVRDYDKGPIHEITLRYSVVEYTQSVRLPAKDHDVYLKRSVDKDGEPDDDRRETARELPPGLVVYTPEREQFLKDILAAMTALDKQMVSLFGGTPEVIAQRMGELLAASHGDPAKMLMAVPPTERSGR